MGVLGDGLERGTAVAGATVRLRRGDEVFEVEAIVACW